MKFPLVTALLGALVALPLSCALGVAAEVGGAAARQGVLDLRLPPHLADETQAGALVSSAPLHALPDLGGQTWQSEAAVNGRRHEDREKDLPYGAGYEARRRGWSGGGGVATPGPRRH